MHITDTVLVIHPFWVMFISIWIGRMTAIPIAEHFESDQLVWPITVLVSLSFTYFSSFGLHVWVLASFLIVAWMLVLTTKISDLNNHIRILEGINSLSDKRSG